MPELIWKFYIDFEIQNGQFEQARALYKRLLQRTKHVKVWISFAKFETSIGRPNIAREIFKEGFQTLKAIELTEERVMLWESWRDFEQEHGNNNSVESVLSNLPKRVKKRRKITTTEGQDAGFEEYYDYIFPDTKNLRSGLKLMEAAQKWKEQMKN